MAQADRFQPAGGDARSAPSDPPAAPAARTPDEPRTPVGGDGRGPGAAGGARQESGPQASLDQGFDRDALVALRSAVAAHGGVLGLAGERLDLLVVVAHELASNAVRHGGGRGRLRLWREGDVVCCEVSDGGPGIADPDPGGWRHPPPTYAEGGRGLYFVQTLADVVTVSSDGTGTVVTAAFAVN
jgi:anti-sigma regulatory factor (Ser/Thr protein kinase)